MEMDIVCGVKPCDDAISREDAEQMFRNIRSHLKPQDYKSAEEFNTRDLMLLNAEQMIHALPSVTQKSGKCKDCKWWKDSDGVYRRGVGAESKCPINNVSVNHGFGYCYMYEPQESEDKE